MQSMISEKPAELDRLIEEYAALGTVSVVQDEEISDEQMLALMYTHPVPDKPDFRAVTPAAMSPEERKRYFLGEWIGGPEDEASVQQDGEYPGGRE